MIFFSNIVTLSYRTLNSSFAKEKLELTNVTGISRFKLKFFHFKGQFCEIRVTHLGVRS